jgi:predicted NBD/HSP70 family sugar kinase
MEYAWSASGFTASDVIAATGLTRATVIAVCSDLVGSGWLAELDNARSDRSTGDYRTGRPARRYSLRKEAAVVVGVDAGYDHMSAIVADLRGHTLGRASVTISALTPQSIGRLADADRRRALVRSVVRDGLQSANVQPERVLALTVGVPAPVDNAGESPFGDNGFWQLMNPALLEVFADAAPVVTVENDANLVAIAERESPTAVGHNGASYVALLAGEGFGAGIMIDNRLLRGRRGGAGEMRFLDHVSGVGSANGLALCARIWATELIRSAALPDTSLLARLHPESLTEFDIALAAEQGDAAAAAILERLAARLTRVCIVLGDLLDVDRVVVGGSVVSSLPAVLQRASDMLTASTDPAAPQLVASALGADAVATGAVEHALSMVRERVLDLKPHSGK